MTENDIKRLIGPISRNPSNGRNDDYGNRSEDLEDEHETLEVDNINIDHV